MAGDNLGVARGSIEINTSSLKNADIALRSAGGSMINFGQMAVGAFAAIVGEAAKFEKEMDFVQAVTNESSETIDKLRDSAIDLAKNSIYGPIALSQAFVELVKAGASAEDIINGVGEASVNLATAADVEIPFAGENLINTLNTFKLGAEDAARVSDLLAGAANASSVELIDLFTSLKYAGPVAQGLGISLEDVNDALSILGKVGIKGSTAGTSLRQVMLNLSPATKKAKTQMEELGIITEDGANKFFDAQGNAKSLSEVFGILGDATKDLNNEQKTAALRDLFGVRAIPAALELLSQGEAGFAAINEEINRTTAADVAAKRMDNLDGSIKRLKATLSAMFVEAGGPFQNMLKGIVDGLREFLLFIDRLPGPLKTFVVGAVGVIGVLSLLAGAFLLTIGNIVRMVRVIAEIKNAFSLFSGAARTATAANSALSASFLLNPMFLLAVAIAAVIAALVLLYFHFKPFRDFIDGLWQDIQKVWDQILGFFRGLPAQFSQYWDNVKKAFESAKNTISDTATQIYDVVRNKIGEAIDYIKGIPGIIGRALGKVPGLFARAFSASLKIAQRFLFVQLPGAVGYAIGFMVGLWLRMVTLLPRYWYKGLNLVLNTAKTWGPKIIGFISRTAEMLLTTFLNFFRQLPGRVLGILNEIFTHLLGWGPMMISTAGGIAANVVNAIQMFLIGLPRMVAQFFLDAVQIIWGLVSQYYSAAWAIGDAVVRGIVDIIGGIPGFLSGIWNTIIAGLTNVVGNAYSAAKSFAGGIWDGFKDGLGIHSPSYIEEALFAIDDQMNLSTKNMADQVNRIHKISRGIPTLNPGAIGLTAAATAASPSAQSSGTQYNQNAPLIGEAVIRDERDAYVLANELEKERARRARGTGALVTNGAL